jgi:quercetin dioxygenase-like cupin family protein
MKVIRLGSAESYEPDKDWKRSSLCNEPDVSVEHFRKPPGHASPLHEHPSAQVLVVLEGELGVSAGDDGEEILAAGDAVYIPGGEPHVVRNPLDRPSVGLDIFVPGRSFDFWRKRSRDAYDGIASLGGRFFGQAKQRETLISFGSGWESTPGLFAWFTDPDFDAARLDEALPHLQKLPGLRGVRLSGTRVTGEEAEKLICDLPDVWVDILEA